MKIAKISSPKAVATLLVLSPIAAQAAITLTFSQVGPNVIAIASGSAVLPGAGVLSNDFPGLGGSEAFNNSLNARADGDIYDIYFSGTATVSLLIVAPDAGSIETNGFGYADSMLLVGDHTLVPGSFWTPQQTFTWTNQSLTDIFGGVAPTETKTVYRFANWEATGLPSENRIDFAFAAIPEPSSVLLIALSSSLFLIRRRSS